MLTFNQDTMSTKIDVVGAIEPVNRLYVESVGRLFRVLSIFQNLTEANDFCRTSAQGVILTIGPLIFLAEMADSGKKLS